jgi:hypothetical protein
MQTKTWFQKWYDRYMLPIMRKHDAGKLTYDQYMQAFEKACKKIPREK